MTNYYGWGVEVNDYDRRFLVGVGYSPSLTGKTADFGHVVRTLTFATRREAREALARFRAGSAWAFKGANRIYLSARIVRLEIAVRVVNAIRSGA